MKLRLASIVAVTISIFFWDSASHPVSAAELGRLYVDTGAVTRPPIGWTQFCTDRPAECLVEPTSPRDAKLTRQSWAELVRINNLVNTAIKPMTDLDQYGVIEKWTYPDSGYGDCEDYALLKQRLLIEAGWPRQALLITVVRDSLGDGHAVLTVRTDRGEFILDNQISEILLWSQTDYRFIKRQAQTSPNVWVSLGDTRSAPATASSR